MPVIQVWSSAVLLGILLLHGPIAQSQMCDEPLQAAFMEITNTTFSTDRILDSDLVFYRETLRFTEAEIERDREAAISFFSEHYGLDFSDIEPDEMGQRVLGNTTFRPFMLTFNGTLIFNQWILNGKSRTRCYTLGNGGFLASFRGIVRLFGEYGGEEGLLVFPGESVLYGHSYLYDVCEQEGIAIRTESLTPIRLDPTDGWIVVTTRLQNRQLGDGMAWGISRVTPINSTTSRFESRIVYTFPED